MDYGPKRYVNDSPWRLSHALQLQRQDSLHQTSAQVPGGQAGIPGIRSRKVQSEPSCRGLVSTCADLHALLEAAGRISYDVIALQETKSRKADLRQLSDGTLIINGEKVPSRKAGGVRFVAHRSVVHLSIRMRSYHLAWLSFDSVCIRKSSLSSTAILQHQQLMIWNSMLFIGFGGSHPQRKLLL
ncbi:unnamed protein product [Strongylus vulgaris]|uniref:Endonuclease/exonuclease/phosphatase domain-containing protein n=1 Tax=Strongylus vulgaris TaxID=40348 RepID=A0A3P7IY04_STRVU|nr:unnamed protein product [Strongylus vulgaris]